MKKLLILSLLLVGCARETNLIGSTVTENKSKCTASSSHYDYHKKKTVTNCSEYTCQAVTTKLAKYAWDDETVSVKDLYSGRCQ